MTTPTEQSIRDAIKTTEYKYFGDYELSPDQWEAVDTLVELARAHLARRIEAEGVPVVSIPGTPPPYGVPVACYHCCDDQHGVATSDGGFRCPNCKRTWGYATPQPDRVAELEAALREVREICANAGRGNPITDERIIDRCEEVAAEALLAAIEKART